jgi:FAD:protein FMN transferase
VVQFKMSFFISALFTFFSHMVWASPDAKNIHCETSRRLPSMGAVFEIQVVNLCAAPLTDDFFVKIQKQLDEIESEMSLYQKNSAINKLNREGKLNIAPKHLLRVLKKSLEISEKTTGLFDVTVESVIKGKAAVASGWQNIIVRNEEISFTRPNVQVTLDGIAKGYAVDQVAEGLSFAGIKSYLVNFSGNMRWQGRRADGHKWRIQIWNPSTRKAQDISPLESGAIASSGGEHNGGHIFNPLNGNTKSQWLQTTIIGQSAETCDALSTTAYLMASKSTIDEMLGSNFKGYTSTQTAKY